jgi:phenylalanine-4-hydroxylase
MGAATAETTSDWIIPQRWGDYTRAEHSTWQTLFERQMHQLPLRVAPAFIDGIHALDIGAGTIPDFDVLSERLRHLTGWSVVAVPGLVPDETFFRHLANRRFVSGRFIRKPEQLDYLEEPDVFHDVFGHVPLLAVPAFADYMQAYGAGGLRSLELGSMTQLARLYWYTVEFGLIRDGDRLRIFGAGIVSSHGESEYALDSPQPLRIGFDLRRIMRTDYRIDAFQRNYFVIDSFEDLRHQTADVDFAPIYSEIASQSAIPVGVSLPTDHLFPPNPS